MYEHNALGYWSGLALCLTKVRSSRACCPATALILQIVNYWQNESMNHSVFSLTVQNYKNSYCTHPGIGVRVAKMLKFLKFL